MTRTNRPEETKDPAERKSRISLTFRHITLTSFLTLFFDDSGQTRTKAAAVHLWTWAEALWPHRSWGSEDAERLFAGVRRRETKRERDKEYTVLEGFQRTALCRGGLHGEMVGFRVLSPAAASGACVESRIVFFRFCQVIHFPLQ